MIQRTVIFSILITDPADHLFFSFRMKFFPHNHANLYFFLIFIVSNYLSIDVISKVLGFRLVIAVVTNFFHLLLDFLKVQVLQFFISKR